MDLERVDDWLPLPDPTAPPRVLTRADAVALGYTANMIQHRLGSGQWTRVLPRTFLTGDSLTWLDRRRAALAFSGPDAVLSAAAALTDLGLRTVARPSSLLVLVPVSTRLRSFGWVTVRPTNRLPARDLRPGPACAPVARAVADLALQRRRLDDVRALVTETVRRKMCTVDELAAELDAGPRNGSAHLRAAIEEAAGGAWSAPEARAARVLRAAHVPPFEQNARIDLPGGRWLIVDFLWRGLRAVLEIDSDEHHGLPGDADETSDRHLVLETLGFSVVHRRPRFVVKQPREFASGVLSWLAGRAALLAQG